MRADEGRMRVLQSAMPLHRLIAAAAFVLAALAPTARAQAPDALVPESYVLDESARRALAAEWLTDVERADLRVFHGVWDARDLDDPARHAIVALNGWELRAPILDDPEVPAVLRAEARLREGRADLVGILLRGDDTVRAARLRAEALEMLGDIDGALAEVETVADRLRAGAYAESAPDLVDAVRCLAIRARLAGQPARDFQTMLDLLARAHQRIDRLHWPAKLVEASILLEKDHDHDGILALHETLRLNPRCAEAWYRLGRVALDRFDFGSAELAAASLRRQHPRHPLADLLTVEARLIQDDPDGALDLLDPLLERLPLFRSAHAYRAAAAGLLYDDAALRAAFEAADALSPGSAEAHFVAGRHLSLNRQYDAAAGVLEEAIRRRPAWPAPRIELGLMEMQSGREDRAHDVLAAVVELDPFNKRAANSLLLLEEMAAWNRVETEHFILKYQPGVDEVMAAMMPEALERIHERVTKRFAFEPPRRTTIELMPDHRRFAVRITGMPWIHTVAACTGPVIALEPPREGRASEHLGLFDWPRVIQHEYTHTVTLAQTNNRIPHWLTEAAAVSMEQSPRAYDTCLLLAEAWRDETLFDLDEIKWGFVRPRRPGDRALAYAQGHWMVEFMNERFGPSALIRLLEQYFQGRREAEAMPAALGVERDAFFAAFLEWAAAQVASWGLAPEPSLEALTDELRWADPEMAEIMAASEQARLDVIAGTLTGQIGLPRRAQSEPLEGDDWPVLIRPHVEITQDTLAAWLEAHRDHPDLVELDLRRRLADAETLDDELIAALERYAALRPVDPWPHKRLADHWLDADAPDRAIPHLEYLDAREEKSPVFAITLARLYRERGDNAGAQAKAERALGIDPYHAANRELAAALAIETRDVALARRHIEALTLLEPDRPQHRKRLEAIERLLGAGGE